MHRLLILLLVFLITALACNLANEAGDTDGLQNDPIEPSDQESIIATPVPPQTLNCEAMINAATWPVYALANGNADVARTLNQGETVKIVAISETEWLQVESNDGWIIGDGFELLGDCTQLPLVIVSPQSNCQVINTSGSPQGIYTDPNTNEAFFARFPPNETLSVFSQQNGFYQVYVTAYENYGWVQQQFITLGELCGDLPTEPATLN